MSNLELWNKVQATNPANTKKVNQRGGFTAIDAYSQIKNATEQFGSYGKGWGMRDMVHTFVPETQMVMCVATFFYEDSNFQISSAIEYAKKDRPDDDFAKKLETDMITKALSRLGFNADVFMGMFDDNKYLAEVTKQFAEKVEVITVDQATVNQSKRCLQVNMIELFQLLTVRRRSKMSATITGKLNKAANEFQAGESTGFGVQLGVQYYDRQTKQKEWTNYKAVIFARAEGQINFYRSALVEGAIIEVTGMSEMIDSYEGANGTSLSIELLDAKLGYVGGNIGAAPQAQQQAPANMSQQPVPDNFDDLDYPF